jgi:hypothetical protein
MEGRLVVAIEAVAKGTHRRADGIGMKVVNRPKAELHRRIVRPDGEDQGVLELGHHAVETFPIDLARLAAAHVLGRIRQPAVRSATEVAQDGDAMRKGVSGLGTS